jgi:membrane fusion protein (multidrug efflux system)
VAARGHLNHMAVTANPQAAPTPPAPPARRRLPRRPKQLKWIVAAIVVLIGAFFGIRYWHESRLFASTDNAYVQANQVEIASQVSGPVSKVYVRDQQEVDEGAPLIDVDPASYELALAKAKAQLEIARQSMSQESAAVASAEAVLAQRRAEAANARGVYQRNVQLQKSGFLSAQGIENSRTQVATADAAVKAAEANVAQAKSALGQSGEGNAQVQAAAAAVTQAELDLQRSHIVSPTHGVVANLTIQAGNTVQPGVPLFVVISDREFWVDANFKETQLEEIREGQAAEIKVDMYPDHPFHGVVQSVSGGSGAAFSLLPPQNATGNWVKVTQRVPVRIKVTDPDPKFPLRIGTTATVKVRK